LTCRAAYGGPAFFATATSMSWRSGVSLLCQNFESWLICANVRWNDALCEHGSQYTSSGAARTYHFEFATLIFAHASSAGTQSFVVKLFAAAVRYATSAASSGFFACVFAASASLPAIAVICVAYAFVYGIATSLSVTTVNGLTRSFAFGCFSSVSQNAAVPCATPAIASG